MSLPLGIGLFMIKFSSVTTIGVFFLYLCVLKATPVEGSEVHSRRHLAISLHLNIAKKL